MTCYPLTKTESTGKIMMPLQTMNSEEFIRDRYDLYLTDELIYNDDGKLKRHYRLHSKEPHRMEDYLAYDILCPKCRKVLKPIGRPIGYNDLGLYACPFCDKH